MIFSYLSSLYKILSAHALNIFCFHAGNFDDDPYTFPSLDCEAAPTFIRRALTAEIKTDSVQKQRSFSRNVSRDAHLTPGPGLGEMFNLWSKSVPALYSKIALG